MFRYFFPSLSFLVYHSLTLSFALLFFFSSLPPYFPLFLSISLHYLYIYLYVSHPLLSIIFNIFNSYNLSLSFSLSLSLSLSLSPSLSLSLSFSLSLLCLSSYTFDKLILPLILYMYKFITKYLSLCVAIYLQSHRGRVYHDFSIVKQII